MGAAAACGQTCLLARPLSAEEKVKAAALAHSWGIDLEESAPISVVGTGPASTATDNGLERGQAIGHDRARSQESRHDHRRHRDRAQSAWCKSPSAPVDRLEKLGLLPFVRIMQRQGESRSVVLSPVLSL
jgi:hypothetical protein